MQFSKIEPPNRRKSWEYARRLVGVTGVEPVTSSLSGTRSNQLSYAPVVFSPEPTRPNSLVTPNVLEHSCSAVEAEAVR